MAKKKFVSLAGLTGNYRVTLVDQEDDPILVRVIASDVLRWEQVNNKSFFEGEVSFSRMVWVAWAALRRQKLTDLDIDKFLVGIIDVEQERVDDDDDEDAQVNLPVPTEADTTA